MNLYEIVIQFANGSVDSMFRPSFHEAREYCRHNISYSGFRVARVEIRCPDNSVIAVWDAAWDDTSKHAGLWK